MRASARANGGSEMKRSDPAVLLFVCWRHCVKCERWWWYNSFAVVLKEMSSIVVSKPSFRVLVLRRAAALPGLWKREQTAAGAELGGCVRGVRERLIECERRDRGRRALRAAREGLDVRRVVDCGAVFC